MAPAEVTRVRRPGRRPSDSRAACGGSAAFSADFGDAASADSARVLILRTVERGGSPGCDQSGRRWHRRIPAWFHDPLRSFPSSRLAAPWRTNQPRARSPRWRRLPMRLAADIRRALHDALGASPGPRARVAALAVVAAITVACASVPGRPSPPTGADTARPLRRSLGDGVGHGHHVVGRAARGLQRLPGRRRHRRDHRGVHRPSRARTAAPGSRSRGKVQDVAVLGGRPLGLHLREQRVRYR